MMFGEVTLIMARKADGKPRASRISTSPSPESTRSGPSLINCLSSTSFRSRGKQSMEKLTFNPVAAPAQATALSPSSSRAARPALMDREADFDIPRKVSTNWLPAIGAREINRALSDAERATLQRRASDLASGLTPMQPHEKDDARAAMHAMLGGFRSRRETGADAQAAVEVLLAILQGFPGWAIEQACLRIAKRQVDIDPPLDPRWAPNDGQVHEIVEAIVKPYRKSLDAAQALLAAPVAKPEPPAIPRQLQHDWHVFAWRRHESMGDGKHAERVAADLAARRVRREAEAQSASAA
jgi:hypothetical protein